MLTSIFTVFTVTYIIRTVYDFLANIDGSFQSTFWGFALVIIWDLVPLWLMLRYHLKSSNALRRKYVDNFESEDGSQAPPSQTMTDALRESLRISSEAGLVPVYENHNQLGESPLIANFRRNHGMFDSVHTMGKNSPQDVIRTQTSNESIVENRIGVQTTLKN